jgi:hypothetical protein
MQDIHQKTCPNCGFRHRSVGGLKTSQEIKNKIAAKELRISYDKNTIDLGLSIIGIMNLNRTVSNANLQAKIYTMEKWNIFFQM